MIVASEPTYTLADLQSWRTRQPSECVALAVIGHPIAHSLSPVMHNAALTELAKTHPTFGTWRYFKFDIAPEQLALALDIFRKEKFRGLNLTVPHKALVVPHLAAKNAFVEDAGAANTLKLTEQGWHGFNTDGMGLSAALQQDLRVSLSNTQVVLLGAGGAARAAAVECLEQQCASLWIANRTPATLSALLTSLRQSKAFAGARQRQPGFRLEGFDPKNPPADLPADALVINATSLGLKPEDDSPLDLTAIPRAGHVFDMIYRPPQTALLRQAAQLSLPNANGLSMLIHQGAASLGIWTGETPPVATMDRAARQALIPA